MSSCTYFIRTYWVISNILALNHSVYFSFMLSFDSNIDLFIRKVAVKAWSYCGESLVDFSILEVLCQIWNQNCIKRQSLDSIGWNLQCRRRLKKFCCQNEIKRQRRCVEGHFCGTKGAVKKCWLAPHRYLSFGCYFHQFQNKFSVASKNSSETKVRLD